jgi:MmeI, target recognition domain
MLRHGGSLGLIATNTIAQGDTRTGGLACILASDGSIFRVVRRLRWPGEAAVIVSVVHVGRGPIKDQAWIDGRRVNRISAFLIDGETDTDPFRLTAVPFFSLGSKIYGQGFLFADGDDSASPLSAMKLLVDKYSTLTGMRIFPYIGGEEVNSDPTHSPHRFAIYLSDLQTEEELDQFPPLRDIVKRLVWPERMKLSSNPNSAPLKKRWWAYQAHRPELYEKLRRSDFAMLNSQVSPHLAFCIARPGAIYAHTLNVVPLASQSLFCSVQSRIHEVWARLLGSSMKDDLRYTPSECFETFPFPPSFGTHSNSRRRAKSITIIARPS